MLDLAAAADRARALIAFTDGLEEPGLGETARRSRVVARDVLELAEALASERSARRASQADYKRCLDVLANAAGGALVEASGSTMRAVSQPPAARPELPNPFLGPDDQEASGA
jgi:hypothetical protein